MTTTPARRARRKTTGRHSPAKRIAEVRALIDSSGGVTVYEISERLGVSVRSAIRYVRALEESGEPLYEDWDGRRKVWRLMPSARHGTIQLSTSQMVSLFLSRRVFDFLEGTGIKEDLDEVFQRLEASLKRKDFVAARNLGCKLFDVNEAPHEYRGRIENVNDIITALIREEQLEVRHASVSRARRLFRIDPYSLLVYKKGLYLAGYSHRHEEIRKFALDDFREVEWKKGAGFAYPADYHPSQLVEGAFGMITGPRTAVRIFFDKEVERFLRRRRWHPSQRIRRTNGGIEMSMEVAGTLELKSWVLGFGDKAEVLEPVSLREEIAQELDRASSRYTRKT